MIVSAGLPKKWALYQTGISTRFSPEPVISLAQTETVVTGVPSGVNRRVGVLPMFPTTIDLFMFSPLSD